MPQPKNLAQYPDTFFDLAKAFSNGLQELRIPFDTPGKATHFRQKFYTFRGLLAKEGNTLVLGINDISIALEGSTAVLSARANCAIRNALAGVSGTITARAPSGDPLTRIPQPSDPFTAPLAGECPDSMEALVDSFRRGESE